MSSPPKQQKQKMKSGQEPFHTASVPSGFALLDYWRWAESDLLNNTRRAIVAEFLVARAVGATDVPRVEWASVDVVTPEGVKIEVKSSAYVQSWGPAGAAPRSPSTLPRGNQLGIHQQTRPGRTIHPVEWPMSTSSAYSATNPVPCLTHSTWQTGISTWSQPPCSTARSQIRAASACVPWQH